MSLIDDLSLPEPGPPHFLPGSSYDKAMKAAAAKIRAAQAAATVKAAPACNAPPPTRPTLEDAPGYGVARTNTVTVAAHASCSAVTAAARASCVTTESKRLRLDRKNKARNMPLPADRRCKNCGFLWRKDEMKIQAFQSLQSDCMRSQKGINKALSCVETRRARSRQRDNAKLDQDTNVVVWRDPMVSIDIEEDSKETVCN